MGNQWKGSDHSRTTSPEHRAWSKAVLERDKYVCQINGPRCIHRATEADHIIADTDGGLLILSNGQAACKPCHLQKTSREANAKRWKNRGQRPTEPHPGLRP